MRFDSSLLFVFASNVLHKAFGLVMGHEVDRCPAKAAARQSRAQAAGMFPRQLDQQVQFFRTIFQQIARDREVLMFDFFYLRQDFIDRELLCGLSNHLLLFSEVFGSKHVGSLPLYRHVEKNARLSEFKCVEFVEDLMYGEFNKSSK